MSAIEQCYRHECPAYISVTDTLTQIVPVGVCEENEIPDILTRVITVGEQMEYEIPSQDDQPLPSFGVSPVYTKKKNMVFFFVIFSVSLF